jgi:hypothetical protein
MHILILLWILLKIFCVDFMKELAEVTAKHFIKAKRAIKKHNKLHHK